MTFEILTTEQLVLRKLSPETFAFVYANYSDIELMAFLGLSNADQLALEKNKFQKGLSTFNKSFLYFQIVDKKSEQIIGWCGYHTWYLDHRRAEIGYGLYFEEYKNSGIMSEALQAILAYGFNLMNLHRVEAMIGSTNIPSLQLAAKFGFKREGVLRSHYFTNNRMEDSVVFSLLEEEWNSSLYSSPIK